MDMGNGEESRLKLLREERGISRKDLAKLCKISFRTLQDYEQGHKDIFSAKAETLLRLSLALNCGMEDLLSKKDLVNVYEEMNIHNDCMLNVDGRCIFVEMMTPPDIEKRKQRLRMYQSHLIKKYLDPIETYVITSQEYKVEGKWRIIDGRCFLQFRDEDRLVRLPFDLDFSDEMIPWLQEVAGLKIDYYIRNKVHEDQDMIMGGEAWDES